MIVETFSRQAMLYDEEATIQKLAAKHLMEELESYQFEEGEFLEIGCGTGFVTQELVKKYLNRRIVITDISEGMLNFCRQKIGVSDRLVYETMNGENFHEFDKYSAIISGCTFQWFLDFDITVLKLFRGLKTGGILCFSFIHDNSFPEWRKMCQKLNIPYTVNQLPRDAELNEIQNQTKAPLKIRREVLSENYSNAREFFRHLKRIGVSSSINGQRLTVSQMKQLINAWNTPFSITYEICYCSLIK